MGDDATCQVYKLNMENKQTNYLTRSYRKKSTYGSFQYSIQAVEPNSYGAHGQ